VGAYLGLRTRRDQSGDTDKQLRITKAGDSYVRRLLVNCANYILGPFGADSELRRWGLLLAERGGQNARRRAKVAVARKLAVLMHRLWVMGRSTSRWAISGRPRPEPARQGQSGRKTGLRYCLGPGRYLLEKPRTAPSG
jgi:hypothetical protein